MATTEVISILQASIGPFVLISGIGLLLLSMTNRLARPIDKLRQTLQRVENAKGREKDFLIMQAHIFFKRSKLLRMAIFFATLSIGFVGTNVLLLFSSLVLSMDMRLIVEIMFTASILSMLISLGFFLFDIKITLHSLKIEMNYRFDQNNLQETSNSQSKITS